MSDLYVSANLNVHACGDARVCWFARARACI